jgi:hypothetical protein
MMCLAVWRFLRGGGSAGARPAVRLDGGVGDEQEHELAAGPQPSGQLGSS